MGNIILCGTHHLDLDGPDRLEKLIRRFVPTTITIESSPGTYAISLARYDRMMGDPVGSRKIVREQLPQHLHEKVDLEFFYQCQVITGYEIWASELYAPDNTLCVPVDDSRLMQGLKAKSAAACTDSDFARYLMSEADFRRQVALEYATAQDGRDAEMLIKGNVIKRNMVMTRFIEHFSKTRGGTLLHLSGYDHVWGSHPNLYDMLKRHKPQRYRLPEADNW